MVMNACVRISRNVMDTAFVSESSNAKAPFKSRSGDNEEVVT